MVFATLKFGVLERKESFKWALRLIPFYIATTCGILTLFIVVEAPTAPSLEEFGVGTAIGIILGVWAGALIIAYVFFMPYFKARLVKEDSRIKYWHIPLGPLLLRDNPPLYWPGKPDGDFVIDYYEDPFEQRDDSTSDNDSDRKDRKIADTEGVAGTEAKTTGASTGVSTGVKEDADLSAYEKGHEPRELLVRRRKVPPGPRERFLNPVKHLPIHNPMRLWGYVKFGLLQGVTRDCVTVCISSSSIR